ncbi:MAG TPA: SCO family protein [Pyrinomonadaceae bacterium]|nr:SCO family protein [Pyrinomonadaceae bacterium]
MIKIRFSTRAHMVLIVVFVSALTCFAQAATPAARPAPSPPASLENPKDNASPAMKYFSDVELVNQDGQKMRFYSDVLKDKVVVINTFFTTCISVCPPMNRNLEKVQEALGDRLGKDAFIVSLSVDPEVDTPPRLKEYSRRFHARPGWIFLTGKKENIDWALYKLGQYVQTRDDHSTIIIIGNEPKGLWKKAMGLARADELMKIVDDVINDR